MFFKCHCHCHCLKSYKCHLVGRRMDSILLRKLVLLELILNFGSKPCQRGIITNKNQPASHPVMMALGRMRTACWQMLVEDAQSGRSTLTRDDPRTMGRVRWKEAASLTGEMTQHQPTLDLINLDGHPPLSGVT